MLVRIKICTQQWQFRWSVFDQVNSVIVFHLTNTSMCFCFCFNLSSTEELRTKNNHFLSCNSPPSLPVPRHNPFHQFLLLVFLMVFSLILTKVLTYQLWMILMTTSWKRRNSFASVTPRLLFSFPNQCLTDREIIMMFYSWLPIEL